MQDNEKNKSYMKSRKIIQNFISIINLQSRTWMDFLWNKTQMHRLGNLSS